MDMDILEAIKRRHSVRQYTTQVIDVRVQRRLEEEIEACNRESGLSIQLVTHESETFKGFLARRGGFKNVTNYLAMVGPKSDGLEQRVGYYGERLVLLAQQHGLNTCWVGTVSRRARSKCAIGPGEKLVCVIAIGHGENQGRQHRSKRVSEACRMPGVDLSSSASMRPGTGVEPSVSSLPEWFTSGVRAALLAPTALNQQGFVFELENDLPSVRSLGGPFSKVDLGIVAYHFEAASGHKLAPIF